MRWRNVVDAKDSEVILPGKRIDEEEPPDSEWLLSGVVTVITTFVEEGSNKEEVNLENKDFVGVVLFLAPDETFKSIEVKLLLKDETVVELKDVVCVALQQERLYFSVVKLSLVTRLIVVSVELVMLNEPLRWMEPVNVVVSELSEGNWCSDQAE